MLRVLAAAVVAVEAGVRSNGAVGRSVVATTRDQRSDGRGCARAVDEFAGEYPTVLPRPSCCVLKKPRPTTGTSVQPPVLASAT